MTDQSIVMPSWCWNGDLSGLYSAQVPCEVPPPFERVYLLNAMVLPKRAFMVHGYPLSAKEAIEILKNTREIVSFIGHEATAKILSRWIGKDIPFNRGEYVPNDRDMAVVARLTRRLASPADVVTIGIDDLEFYAVGYKFFLVDVNE